MSDSASGNVPQNKAFQKKGRDDSVRVMTDFFKPPTRTNELLALPSGSKNSLFGYFHRVNKDTSNATKNRTCDKSDAEDEIQILSSSKRSHCFDTAGQSNKKRTKIISDDSNVSILFPSPPRLRKKIKLIKEKSDQPSRKSKTGWKESLPRSGSCSEVSNDSGSFCEETNPKTDNGFLGSETAYLISVLCASMDLEPSPFLKKKVVVNVNSSCNNKSFEHKKITKRKKKEIFSPDLNSSVNDFQIPAKLKKKKNSKSRRRNVAKRLTVHSQIAFEQTEELTSNIKDSHSEEIEEKQKNLSVISYEDFLKESRVSDSCTENLENINSQELLMIKSDQCKIELQNGKSQQEIVKYFNKNNMEAFVNNNQLFESKMTSRNVNNHVKRKKKLKAKLNSKVKAGDYNSDQVITDENKSLNKSRSYQIKKRKAKPQCRVLSFKETADSENISDKENENKSFHNIAINEQINSQTDFSDLTLKVSKSVIPLRKSPRINSNKKAYFIDTENEFIGFNNDESKQKFFSKKKYTTFNQTKQSASRKRKTSQIIKYSSDQKKMIAKKHVSKLKKIVKAQKLLKKAKSITRAAERIKKRLSIEPSQCKYNLRKSTSLCSSTEVKLKCRLLSKKKICTELIREKQSKLEMEKSRINIPLAPIFLSRKEKEGKKENIIKVSEDPEIVQARKAFLMSGVPETLRKQIIIPVSFNDCPSFSKVIHVQQANDDGVWKLSMPNLNLKIMEPYKVNLVGEGLNFGSLTKSSFQDNFKLTLKKPKKYSEDLVRRFLDELEQQHINFPLRKLYEKYRRQKKENEKEIESPSSSNEVSDRNEEKSQGTRNESISRNNHIQVSSTKRKHHRKSSKEESVEVKPRKKLKLIHHKMNTGKEEKETSDEIEIIQEVTCDREVNRNDDLPSSEQIEGILMNRKGNLRSNKIKKKFKEKVVSKDIATKDENIKEVKIDTQEINKSDDSVIECTAEIFQLTGRERDSLWTELYQPTCSEDIHGNDTSVRKLKTWLSEWKLLADRETRKPMKMQAQKVKRGDKGWSDGSDFICDSSSEYDDKICNTMLITGPSSSGKTSIVYALAQELGYKVFEVNASSRRSGKRVLAQLQEATQSHQVSKKNLSSGISTDFKKYSISSDVSKLSLKKKSSSKTFSSFFQSAFTKKTTKIMTSSIKSVKKRKKLALSKASVTVKMSRKRKHRKKHKKHSELKKASSKSKGLKLSNTSVILFEDVDLVFEEDEGFWGAINTFMQETKRPIILTTNDESFSMTYKMKFPFEQLHFKPPSKNVITAILRVICLVENVCTSISDVEELVMSCRNDLRQCLLQMQFLVESGTDRKMIKLDNDLKQNQACNEQKLDFSSCKEFSTVDQLMEPKTEVNISLVTPTEEELADDQNSIWNNEFISHFYSSNFSHCKLKSFNIVDWMSQMVKCFDDHNLSFLESGCSDERISSVSKEIKIKPEIESKNKKITLLKSVKAIDEFIDTIAFMNSQFQFTDGGDDVSRWFDGLKPGISDEIPSIDEQSFVHNSLTNEINTTILNLNMSSYSKNISQVASNVNINWLSDFPERLTSQERAMATSTKTYKKIWNSVSPICCLSHRAIELDYLPTLRSICKAESLKQTGNTKRRGRFLHYLDSVGCHLKSTTIDFLSKSLKMNF